MLQNSKTKILVILIYLQYFEAIKMAPDRKECIIYNQKFNFEYLNAEENTNKRQNVFTYDKQNEYGKMLWKFTPIAGSNHTYYLTKQSKYGDSFLCKSPFIKFFSSRFKVQASVDSLVHTTRSNVSSKECGWRLERVKSELDNVYFIRNIMRNEALYVDYTLNKGLKIKLIYITTLLHCFMQNFCSKRQKKCLFMAYGSHQSK
jgi:hypothetical protein